MSIMTVGIDLAKNDKLALSFRSFVHLACTFVWLA